MGRTLARVDIYSELNQRLRNFESRMSSKLDRAVTIRDIPLKKFTEAVGIDDSLVDAKVHDLVVQGAEDDETLWTRMAQAVYMDRPKEVVEFITQDDFKLAPWTQGTKPRSSGGSFWGVELDTSVQKNLYAMDLNISRNWIRDNPASKLESALRAAGQAVGRFLIQKIVAKYIADKDASMTDTLANWGDLGALTDNHYAALVKMESLIADEGMNPDIILVNPAEGAELASYDYFVSQDYERVAKAIPQSLHSVGMLYGKIPIIRHRDVTAASMIMADAHKSMVLGIREDIKIEDYESIREGLQGAIVSVQYDIKSGKDAAGPSGATKPTDKAWAVCTSA